MSARFAQSFAQTATFLSGWTVVNLSSGAIIHNPHSLGRYLKK